MPGASLAMKRQNSFVGSDTADVKLNESLNSKYWEIQMVVRYDPDDIDWHMVDMTAAKTSGRLKLSLEERKALKSFLRNSAISLRLQFVGHTIRYSSNSSGADPELVIDFEYKAYIESSMNSHDLDLLMVPGEETRKILQWEDRLAHARRALYAVQRDKLNLGAIFGGRGETSTKPEPNLF